MKISVKNLAGEKVRDLTLNDAVKYSSFKEND